MRLPLRKIKVFSKEWFRFWQPLLLLAVNFPVKSIREDIRHRLGIDQDNLPLDVPIVELMRHAYTVMTGWNKYQTVFRTHDKYAKRLFYEWKYIWNLVHRWDVGFANKFIPSLNLGFDTLVAYPDADPETNTVDGRVRNSGSVLSTVLSGSSGDSAQDNNSTIPIAYAYYLSPTYYVNRAFFLFNTSSLTAGATILGATISLYVDDKTNNESMISNIVSSSPASDTSLGVDDFDQVGSTSFASLTIASATTGAYNDFVLDANGINNISKTGISKFGERSDKDLNVTDFTQANYTNIASADREGTTQDPKLVITYTLPVTSTPLHHGKPGLQTSDKAHGRKGL